MLVKLNGVDQSFLVVYLAANKKKWRFIRESQLGCVYWTLVELEDVIDVKYAYNLYQSRNQSFDEFFDCQVVECIRSDSTEEIFHPRTRKISRIPVFVGVPKNAKRDGYRFIKFNQIKTKSPIETTEKIIAKMHDLPDQFECITDLYEKYDVNFRFLELKGNQASISEYLPGMRQGGFQMITVGKRGKSTFWMTNDYPVQERLYCTKYPGKCTYWSLKPCDIKKHMETCRDYAIFQATKVKLMSELI